MQERTVMQVMMLLALATPVVGLLLWWLGQRTTGEEQDLPPDLAEARASMRRKGLLLAAAGPLSLALWWVFNVWLDAQPTGGQSVLGYAVAVVVFIVAGFATGFFARLGNSHRLRSGRRRGEHPSDGPPQK